MRVLFLCGSLEPGRDGVGDYTRRLAAELIRGGHQAAGISLNDHRIDTAARSEQYDGNTPVPVLRLSAKERWESRALAAQNWTRDFNPDWISLQFVPYSFDRRGLLIAALKPLRQIISDRRLHVMLHELWVFPWLRTKLSDRLVGMAQRWTLRRMLRKLRPKKISTQNSFYRDAVAGWGLEVSLLPLHGNIPVVNSPGAVSEFGRRHHLPPGNSPGGSVAAGFFGSIRDDIDCLPLLKKLAAAARSEGRRLCICSAGHIGERGVRLWNAWQEALGPNAEFRLLGSLSNEEVSYYLQSLAFGLTSYTTEFVEKSGAVAAFLEHGRRVVLAQRHYLSPDAPAQRAVMAVEPGWQRRELAPAALWADGPRILAEGSQQATKRFTALLCEQENSPCR